MNELLLGDCRGLNVSALAVDHMLTDLPYSRDTHDRIKKSVGTGRNCRQRNLSFASLSPSLRRYFCGAPIPGWRMTYSDWIGAGMIARQLAHPGFVVCVSSRDLDGAPSGVPIALPWVRWSSPVPGSPHPPSGSEVLIYSRGPRKPRYFGPRNLCALTHKCERGEKKHTAAKPLDQALDLVAWFTLEGERVYDPCMGRGTFGVACTLLGRAYLGVELDVTEYRLACQRIRAAERGVLSPRDAERYARWRSSRG